LFVGKAILTKSMTSNDVVYISGIIYLSAVVLEIIICRPEPRVPMVSHIIVYFSQRIPSRPPVDLLDSRFYYPVKRLCVKYSDLINEE
jgi:hypothetical protein